MEHSIDEFIDMYSFGPDGSYTFYYLLDYEFIRTTERAVLVRDKQRNEEWIPKSVLRIDTKYVGSPEKPALVLSEWFKNKSLLNKDKLDWLKEIYP